MPILTTAITVKFTLYSSAAPAPYNVAGCDGTIYYNDNTDVEFLWQAAVAGGGRGAGLGTGVMLTSPR